MTNNQLKINMQKSKQTKLFQFSIIIITAIIIYLGVTELFNKAEVLSLTNKAKAVDFFYTGYEVADVGVTVKRKEKAVKQYAYNERVPAEVVKDEIIKQSKEFNLGENFMLQLAFDESGYNNLATNSKSTATGLYQYLWGTWKETESWKNHHIARTDYKANIREAMIDISNGEHFRWSESLK